MGVCIGHRFNLNFLWLCHYFLVNLFVSHCSHCMSAWRIWVLHFMCETTISLRRNGSENIKHCWHMLMSHVVRCVLSVWLWRPLRVQVEVDTKHEIDWVVCVRIAAESLRKAIVSCPGHWCPSARVLIVDVSVARTFEHHATRATQNEKSPLPLPSSVRLCILK